jgi:hypothetical protein
MDRHVASIIGIKEPIGYGIYKGCHDYRNGND